MAVELMMDPLTNEISWSEFISSRPQFSVALDGYVPEGPQFDPRGPFLNLNHHEGVSRLETRASCAQARVHVQQGLFQSFSKSGEPQALVWLNDCDQDACFSWVIFHHPEVLKSEEFLRLLDIVDMRDTTGGFCAPPLRPEDGEALAWIFEPYQTFRFSGRISERNQDAFRATVYAVEARVLCYLEGRGDRLPADMIYRVIGSGAGWTMVEESSTDARMQMHADGIRAFVSARERPDGLWQYSIGRSSPVVSFPLPTILARLRRAERDAKHTWGGSEVIAGCNRVVGSSLSPDEVTRIIESVVRPADRFHQVVWASLTPRLTPREIRRGVQLASVLEPLSEKEGCTTRMHDVSSSKKLGFFLTAGINIGDTFEELATRFSIDDNPRVVYDLACRAQADSKKNRGGGRTNQGIIEFLFPLVLSICKVHKMFPKRPEEVIEAVPVALGQTSEEDTLWLQRMQNLAFEMSGHVHRVSNLEPASDVAAYYQRRLAASVKPSDLFHNREVVDGFPTLRFMLQRFEARTSTDLSQLMGQIYNTVRSHHPDMPAGMIADLVACLIFLHLMADRTATVVE